MIADADTIEETAQPLPTEEQQDAAFFRDVLLDIIDAAGEFAKLLLTTAQRASQQGAPPDDILRLAAAFERTSRSARRGILLARHVKKPLKQAAVHQPGRQPRAPSPHTLAPGQPERQTDIRDRLDAIDRIAALSPGQLPAAIADLKRDLTRVFDELSKPRYKPRTPEDLHRLDAHAATPDAANAPIPDH